MDFFAQVTALAALAVLLVQQILRLKVVPLDFANKYPVPTNIALSVIATIVVVWQKLVIPVVWTDWIVLAATVSVVSAIVYNQLIGRWKELQELQGSK